MQIAMQSQPIDDRIYVKARKLLQVQIFKRVDILIFSQKPTFSNSNLILEFLCSVGK